LTRAVVWVDLGRKTTLEINNATWQKATVRAAQEGIRFKELFKQALEEKLLKSKPARRNGSPPWLKLAGAFGKTRAVRAETRRIQKAIDAEFERIDSGGLICWETETKDAKGRKGSVDVFEIDLRIGTAIVIMVGPVCSADAARFVCQMSRISKDEKRKSRRRAWRFWLYRSELKSL
jgi:hypothetical protein